MIVTEDGYILTNCHLLDGANVVEVTLQDGRDFKAKVIGLDAKSRSSRPPPSSCPRSRWRKAAMCRWAIWSWRSAIRLG